MSAAYRRPPLVSLVLPFADGHAQRPPRDRLVARRRELAQHLVALAAAHLGGGEAGPVGSLLGRTAGQRAVGLRALAVAAVLGQAGGLAHRSERLREPLV